MNEYKLREQICEIGRRVYAKGFAAANDGNISVRLNDREVLCTPTMMSKGYLKPEDLCVVDYEGKQLRGTRKRSSEILLHLAVYRHNPAVQAVVHCHPPHATAFAVAGEPIPKCVLPEVEVFLGEVPIAEYETPGTQKFADTIVPFVQKCNTIILANHGTVTFGPDLEKAYWYSEIIDAYCRILILARQLGRVNYFSEKQTRELLELKKRLGYDDPRLHQECQLCGPNIIQRGYRNYEPEPFAFVPTAEHGVTTPCSCQCVAAPAADGQASSDPDLEHLVRVVTDRVLAALGQAS
ncbi:MAG: class II aldolase/adducin family protein [Gemmataceae bacterium]|nr:class II aldolase/adducin family protein [Gemmataceae bacterium]MDW8267227.1 class II aldolase/adducin family protein [Gemmataceae bacterium]